MPCGSENSSKMDDGACLCTGADVVGEKGEGMVDLEANANAASADLALVLPFMPITLVRSIVRYSPSINHLAV